MSENNLKAMRHKRGLSQARLADKADVSLRMIQYYEQGSADINKAEALTVLKIADALDCGVRDILNI